MATLEGLLALFRDNDSGRISAGDIRHAITQLWNRGDNPPGLGGISLQRITQDDYDALDAPRNPNILYIITP